jgi:glycosyltransferase involved in cell wall biosynthesis
VRILIDYRPALRQRTGVGEYVHELAAALVQSAPPSGETLTLFSSSWKDRLAADAIAGTRTIDRRIPVRLLNFAWHRLKWPAIEALTGESFDIVQSAHPLPIPSRRAAQLVTVHDLDFLDHPERTRAEIRRDYPSLAPKGIRDADHVLVNSKHTAADVEHRLGVSPDRISVCSPGAPPWPKRTEEPPDGYVLFLGTLEPRKNVGVLLDAYARLLARGTVRARLALAGAAPPEAKPLIDRTAEAPLAGHVDLLGYVDPDRRLEVYRRALVLVLPSHAEGFGIPALEAMTVGVPVIAANRGALPEVVGDAGQLVDPDDPDLLAEALRVLLGDRALRDRLREAGWRQAQRFQWSTSASRAREAWHLALQRRMRRG